MPTKRHVFSVCYNEDGLRLDTYAACNWDGYADMTAAGLKATVAMLGKIPDELEEFLRNIEGMELRLRYSGAEGLFVLMDEEGDLDADTIEEALRAMPKEKRRQFLRASKI